MEPVVGSPDTVSPGGHFTVHGPAMTPLPDQINCTISSTVDGDTIQWNVLDVSGQVGLFLKDKFGALQLE